MWFSSKCFEGRRSLTSSSRHVKTNDSKDDGTTWTTSSSCLQTTDIYRLCFFDTLPVDPSFLNVFYIKEGWALRRKACWMLHWEFRPCDRTIWYVSFDVRPELCHIRCLPRCWPTMRWNAMEFALQQVRTDKMEACKCLGDIKTSTVIQQI